MDKKKNFLETINKLAKVKKTEVYEAEKKLQIQLNKIPEVVASGYLPIFGNIPCYVLSNGVRGFREKTR